MTQWVGCFNLQPGEARAGLRARLFNASPHKTFHLSSPPSFPNTFKLMTPLKKHVKKLRNLPHRQANVGKGVVPNADNLSDLEIYSLYGPNPLLQ